MKSGGGCALILEETVVIFKINKSGLTDYKVHCFNGEPKLILVCKERFGNNGMTEDFYSTEWEQLDIRRPFTQFAEEPVEKPEKLEEMLELSSKLSKGIPFLRTDFYIADNKIYIGEITFFPASGFKQFVPDEWDKTLGDWLKLPMDK